MRTARLDAAGYDGGLRALPHPTSRAFLLVEGRRWELHLPSLGGREGRGWTRGTAGPDAWRVESAGTGCRVTLRLPDGGGTTTLAFPGTSAARVRSVLDRGGRELSRRQAARVTRRRARKPHDPT